MIKFQKILKFQKFHDFSMTVATLYHVRNCLIDQGGSGTLPTQSTVAELTSVLPVP